MRLARVNEAGRRIGEGHHMARLSDREVDQLIADRGSDDAPRMSYSELATKYGISKSSVRDILIGRRRGQIGPSVDKPKSKKAKRPMAPYARTTSARRNASSAGACPPWS